MITWCCLFFSVVVQYISAQAIPYGMPNRPINANNARGIPNAMAMGRGLPNGMTVSNNQIVRNIPMAANNMARGNNVNRQNANSYFANNKLINNFSYGKVANLMANGNVIESNLENPLTHASQVLANDITAAALENFASANILPNVGTPIANVPKRATYNFGNSPISVTVTGTSHGNQPVGINILADNLEVKGMVSVVGRMPIYGAVTLNGNVPSDGKASVNYSCGSPAAV